jgi:hypothetical protein
MKHHQEAYLSSGICSQDSTTCGTPSDVAILCASLPRRDTPSSMHYALLLMQLDHIEIRCEVEPLEASTVYGADSDLYFGQCYQGPGFCRTVEFITGPFGVCVGIPTFGATCNDVNGCKRMTSERSLTCSGDSATVSLMLTRHAETSTVAPSTTG